MAEVPNQQAENDPRSLPGNLPDPEPLKSADGPGSENEPIASSESSEENVASKGTRQSAAEAVDGGDATPDSEPSGDGADGSVDSPEETTDESPSAQATEQPAKKTFDDRISEYGRIKEDWGTPAGDRIRTSRLMHILQDRVRKTDSREHDKVATLLVKVESFPTLRDVVAYMISHLRGEDPESVTIDTLSNYAHGPHCEALTAAGVKWPDVLLVVQGALQLLAEAENTA